MRRAALDRHALAVDRRSRAPDCGSPGRGCRHRPRPCPTPLPSTKNGTPASRASRKQRRADRTRARRGKSLGRRRRRAASSAAPAGVALELDPSLCRRDVEARSSAVDGRGGHAVTADRGSSRPARAARRRCGARSVRPAECAARPRPSLRGLRRRAARRQPPARRSASSSARRGSAVPRPGRRARPALARWCAPAYGYGTRIEATPTAATSAQVERTGATEDEVGGDQRIGHAVGQEGLGRVAIRSGEGSEARAPRRRPCRPRRRGAGCASRRAAAAAHRRRRRSSRATACDPPKRAAAARRARRRMRARAASRSMPAKERMGVPETKLVPGKARG